MRLALQKKLKGCGEYMIVLQFLVSRSRNTSLTMCITIFSYIIIFIDEKSVQSVFWVVWNV